MENLLNVVNIENILLSGGLVLGIIICLFGVKFQKLILALIGIVVGYSLGNILVDLFAFADPNLALVVKAGCALVIGVFSFTLFESLVAVAAGVGTFVITTDMIGNIWYSYLIGVILGIAAFMFVSKYLKLGLVVFTSFVGSYMITNGILTYLAVPYLLVFVIVFAISFVFQCSTNKIRL